MDDDQCVLDLPPTYILYIIIVVFYGERLQEKPLQQDFIEAEKKQVLQMN